MPNNLTDFEENRLLDLSVVAGDYVALMSVVGTDSLTGTEVTGGGYGRASAAFGSAASGAKASNAAHLFLNMPASDLQGWAVFSAASAGNRKWYGLFHPRSGSASASTNVVTSTAHGLVDDDPIVFQSGYAPTGVASSTKYFVRDSTSDSFKVTGTIGGSAIDITADMTETVFGDVLTINAGEVLAIPVGSLVLSLS